MSFFSSPPASISAGSGASRLNGFRLTTESGVPVSSADRLGQSTIYLTPAVAGLPLIELYDGTTWQILTSPEVAFPIVGRTPNSVYDLFGYKSGSAVALEWSAAWSSNVAPTDSIGVQDGVPVKASDHTRRWLGTVRATSATTTEDSANYRLVANLYNRERRAMKRREVNSIHNGDQAGSFREWNGGGGGPHRLGFVTCNPQVVSSNGWSELKGNGNDPAFVSLSLDTTTAEGLAVATNPNGGFQRLALGADYAVPAGYNELIVTELSFGASTFNYYSVTCSTSC